MDVSISAFNPYSASMFRAGSEVKMGPLLGISYLTHVVTSRASKPRWNWDLRLDPPRHDQKKKKHRRKKKIQKIKPLTISEMNLHTYLVRLAKLAPRTDVQHRSDIDLHTQNDSLRSSCDAAAIRGGCSVGGVALKSNNFSALPALSSWNNKLCSGRRWRWWWWW